MTGAGDEHHWFEQTPDGADEELLADMMVLAEAGDMGPDEGAIDVAPGVLDRFDAVRRFDAWADHAFDGLRGNKAADRAFYAVTELGDFSLLWLLLGAVRGLRSDEDADEFFRLALALGIDTVVINGMLKSVFSRERPVVQEPRPHKLRIPMTTSFPSGHATSAMVATAILGDGRRSRPAYLALGLWVASSRVYVKIHHASDVVAGLAIGAALGHVLTRVIPRRRR